MPILTVSIVGDSGADPGGLARRIADRTAELFETGPGRTWVRLQRLPTADYAENGDVDAGPPPVFVEVLLRDPPPLRSRARLSRALAEAVGELVGRPGQRVHVLFTPSAGGRIAFGGELVPPVEAQRVSTGAPWEAVVGYSRAVRIGPHVWVTGTVALDEDGAPAGGGDAGAQARQALSVLTRVLERVDATPRDVMRTRMFVTDIERDWQAIGRAHAELFGESRPATTMVEVRRLIEPWMLVEIEADAYVRE